MANYGTAIGGGAITSSGAIVFSGGVEFVSEVLTDGQVVIGSTGGVPSGATLTASTGIEIANGSSSITISAALDGYDWTDATNASYQMISQNGYIADRGTLVTFTLPTNCAIGETINVMGLGAGGWRVIYGTGQYIQWGAVATTTTTGSLSSNNQYDNVKLVCIISSGTAPIFAIQTVIGNLSYT